MTKINYLIKYIKKKIVCNYEFYKINKLVDKFIFH